MISRLINRSGDVRDLLGASHDDSSTLDISGDGWEETLVLNGLTFRNTVLHDQKVNVNLVSCVFEKSLFSDIEAGNVHFWGAQNRWSGCSFRNVSIPQAICPYNVFS